MGRLSLVHLQGSSPPTSCYLSTPGWKATIVEHPPCRNAPHIDSSFPLLSAYGEFSFSRALDFPKESGGDPRSAGPPMIEEEVKRRGGGRRSIQSTMERRNRAAGQWGWSLHLATMMKGARGGGGEKVWCPPMLSAPLPLFPTFSLPLPSALGLLNQSGAHAGLGKGGEGRGRQGGRFLGTPSR